MSTRKRFSQEWASRLIRCCYRQQRSVKEFVCGACFLLNKLFHSVPHTQFAEFRWERACYIKAYVAKVIAESWLQIEQNCAHYIVTEIFIRVMLWLQISDTNDSRADQDSADPSAANGITIYGLTFVAWYILCHQFLKLWLLTHSHNVQPWHQIIRSWTDTGCCAAFAATASACTIAATACAVTATAQWKIEWPVQCCLYVSKATVIR